MSMLVDGSEQDFDLNIAPIIDCFTVLIAYLLISASFVSMGFFDVGVSTTSEVTAAADTKPPEEFMSVALGQGNSLTIHLRGPETRAVAISPRGGARDYAGLVATVKEVRAKWPSLSEASVSADPEVGYGEIIRTIETLKKEISKVYVGE